MSRLLVDELKTVIITTLEYLVEKGDFKGFNELLKIYIREFEADDSVEQLIRQVNIIKSVLICTTQLRANPIIADSINIFEALRDRKIKLIKAAA